MNGFMNPGAEFNGFPPQFLVSQMFVGSKMLIDLVNERKNALDVLVRFARKELREKFDHSVPFGIIFSKNRSKIYIFSGS
jgi:hypothetical protein